MENFKLVVLLALLLGVAEARGSEENAATWTLVLNETQSSPVPVRGEFSMNTYNGSQLILFGGCNIAFDRFYNDLWVFDASQTSSGEGGKWFQLRAGGDTPPGSCGHGAAVIQDTLYVYGGLVASKSGVSNELHSINLAERPLVWKRISRGGSGVWPPARSLIQHSMEVNAGGDGFILASGTSSLSDDDDSAFLFSVSEGVWRKISKGQGALSGNIGGSAIGITDSGLFVLGGFRKGVMDALLFLPESEWSPSGTFKRLPSDLGGLAFEGMVVVDRRFLVVYGGFAADAINPFVYAYDTIHGSKSGSWCKIAVQPGDHGYPLPHFASGLSSVSSGDIFAFGGRINPSGSRELLATDLWRLTTTLDSCFKP